MYPLYRQAQIVCDFARQAPRRVLELEVPPELDGFMSHSELQTQITLAREYLGTLTPEDFEDRDGDPVTFPITRRTLIFSGQGSAGFWVAT